MLKRLIVAPILLMVIGMACQNEQPTRRISDVLTGYSEKTEGQDHLDLLVLLPKGVDQNSAFVGVDKEAGLLSKVPGSNSLYRQQGAKDKIETLGVVADVKVSLNDSIKIQSNESPGHRFDQLRAAGAEALDLTTVRNVVGVDELLNRFPSANGHGVKVAVFDTGIDFGINSLSAASKGKKLEGFYDFTNFGKVDLTPVSEGLTDIGLRFAEGLAPKKIIAKGILSEKQLAKDYLASEGIDLNGNGATLDEFAFILGLGDDGQYRVWIDIDGNGIISDPTSEILSDFNKSHQYIDMVGRGEQKGSHALAVTIHSEEVVQFHRVMHGHGTACALIIGGDAYGDGSLMGLAPKTTFLSYTLDVTGQDIYTMDQFLDMFLHAKEQVVDAISISWGFSTSDLASARFFADFLDQEISSQGILVAIAAGNNGPGVSSGPSDDYIPHHGFGVGAMICRPKPTMFMDGLGLIEMQWWTIQVLAPPEGAV
ncbi:MAG: S8 family serine peptidase [Oligoflexales bacterium]|nr:S8 family serine peptidase [Oligoflexales bacterium]